MKTKYSRIMLKLSGEVLQGDQESGIDFGRLTSLCEEIIEMKKKTGVQVVIVVGGGNIWRYRDFKDSHIERVNSDYIGMMATVMNATAMRSTFEHLGVQARVCSSLHVSQIVEPFVRDNAVNHLENDRIVICAGGTGNPFFTTDSAAALRGLELHCDVMLKATKVDGVYDKDPVAHADAKRFENITFSEVLAQDLKVMDLAAVSLCKEGGLPIVVFDLQQKGNIYKVVCGESIGTNVT